MQFTKPVLLFLLFSLPVFTIHARANLYLDLMKKILINSIYQDPGAKPSSNPGSKLEFKQYNHEARKRGKDWPSLAHTMVGLARLNNIQQCAEDVIMNDIPGDFIETGVWRGGSTIFMRAILKAYNITDKLVWVADSFQGLPAPDSEQYPADSHWQLHKINYLSVALETVKDNFRRYSLLDEQVVFLKGWFKDTIPFAPIEKIALLRLDGDMYESTMDVLVHLYPKLSIGGYIIIDDYNLSSCKKAIQDYRRIHKIDTPIQTVDGAGVYWKKEK